MTFSLRRKRPTTPPRAPSTPTATAVSLLAGWLLLAGAAGAQGPEPVHWAASGTQRTQRLQQATFRAQEAGPKGDERPVPPPINAKEKESRIGERESRIKPSEEEDLDFLIETEAPGLDRLTRRESEGQFYERVRQESRRRPGVGRVFFPDPEPVSTETYEGRNFPHAVHRVEPNYVCHRRLYFDQPNFERHGWELGPLTPAVNLGRFYYDVLLFPYHYWSHPCDRCDCSAGKCLPGDPTPFLLYREEFSVTGLAGQAGAVLGGIAIFP